MRIKLISDIHVEWHEDHGTKFVQEFNPDNYDVLVLAGDIGTKSIIVPFLEALSRKDGGKTKILVPGNHEYYGSTLNEAKQNILKNKPECVKFLDNSLVTIDGQRFVGSTFWFSDGGNPSKAFVEDMRWADFRYISDLRGKAYGIHDESMDFLCSTISEGDIVVTHHLPHKNAISPRFKNSTANRYFQTDVRENVIEKAKFWLFGHTHDTNNFQVGNCHLVSNPLGYPGENETFNEFVFEV